MFCQADMEVYFSIGWPIIFFFWSESCFLKQIVRTLHIMFGRELRLFHFVDLRSSLWTLSCLYSKSSSLSPSCLENSSPTSVSVSSAFSFILFCGNSTPEITKHEFLEYYFCLSRSGFNKSLVFVTMRFCNCVSRSNNSKYSTCFFVTAIYSGSKGFHSYCKCWRVWRSWSFRS